MFEILSANPWLIVLVLVAIVAIACTAIVFVTEYLRRTHQLELDAMLKRELVARGLSADDIKTILEATSDAEEKRLAMSGQGLRVGLGKLRVEAGSLQNSPDRWRGADTAQS